MKKENFFLYYILISISILFLSFKNNDSFINRTIILGIICFFGIALRDHFYEIKSLISREKNIRKIDYQNIFLIIGTALSAAITWYINHTLGYGPIIANGIVGIFVGLLFSSKKLEPFI